MAFLGELVAGVGAVATAVAPVVSAYQGISSLFRPAVRQPPTPHAFFGGGFSGWGAGATGDYTFQRPWGQQYWGMPRARWQTPTVRAMQQNPTYVVMKSDWLERGAGEWR